MKCSTHCVKSVRIQSFLKSFTMLQFQEFNSKIQIFSIQIFKKFLWLIIAQALFTTEEKWRTLREKCPCSEFFFSHSPCNNSKNSIQRYKYFLFKYSRSFYGWLLLRPSSLLRKNEARCVKSVRIRSFSGPYFPAFGMNTKTPYFSVFSPNAGKYGPQQLRIRTLFCSDY